MGGDKVTIEDAGTIDDTAPATVADASITGQIDYDNVSYHGGVYNEDDDHYRLVVDGNHCITVNNSGCIIDGLAIVQAGVGASDEGIRMAANIGTLTVKHGIIRAATQTSDQDGIHVGNLSGTIVNVENTIIEGFGRAGIAGQPTGGLKNQTYNINSSTMKNCQSVEDVDGGGVAFFQGGTPTFNINMFNIIIMDCNTPSADDYNESGAGGTMNWDLQECVASDGSITARDPGAVDPLENRIATDNPAPGVGDFVIFKDISISPFNLLLQDNPIDNDAQHAHSATSGAGMTLPILDITAQVRDRDPNMIDIGADEAEPTPPPDDVNLPEYGQIRTAIGDPPVYGATILRS